MAFAEKRSTVHVRGSRVRPNCLSRGCGKMLRSVLGCWLDCVQSNDMGHSAERAFTRMGIARTRRAEGRVDGYAARIAKPVADLATDHTTRPAPAAAATATSAIRSHFSAKAAHTAPATITPPGRKQYSSCRLNRWFQSIMGQEQAQHHKPCATTSSRAMPAWS